MHSPEPADSEWAGEGELREGRDFATTAEFVARAQPAAGRVVRQGAGRALARAVAEETDWLMRTGQLPGGLAWDDQPAWRVRLWAHSLAERERAVALAVEMA